MIVEGLETYARVSGPWLRACNAGDERRGRVKRESRKEERSEQPRAH